MSVIQTNHMKQPLRSRFFKMSPSVKKFKKTTKSKPAIYPQTLIKKIQQVTINLNPLIVKMNLKSQKPSVFEWMPSKYKKEREMEIFHPHCRRHHCIEPLQLETIEIVWHRGDSLTG